MHRANVLTQRLGTSLRPRSTSPISTLSMSLGPRQLPSLGSSRLRWRGGRRWSIGCKSSPVGFARLVTTHW